jgi:Rrf2 family protein
MKISTKGRYAVRILLDLARHDDGQPCPVKEIADRQGISEKYLEQIISTLHKAGFVKSIRGAQGGYSLTKEPEQYTVGMILRVMEGSLAPVACLEDDYGVCERCDTCETLEVWKQIYDAVNNVVDHISLADLAAKGSGETNTETTQ